MGWVGALGRGVIYEDDCGDTERVLIQWWELRKGVSMGRKALWSLVAPQEAEEVRTRSRMAAGVEASHRNTSLETLYHCSSRYRIKRVYTRASAIELLCTASIAGVQSEGTLKTPRRLCPVTFRTRE
jgi:hypothetical protein